MTLNKSLHLFILFSYSKNYVTSISTEEYQNYSMLLKHSKITQKESDIGVLGIFMIYATLSTNFERETYNFHKNCHKNKAIGMALPTPHPDPHA